MINGGFVWKGGTKNTRYDDEYQDENLEHAQGLQGIGFVSQLTFGTTKTHIHQPNARSRRYPMNQRDENHHFRRPNKLEIGLGYMALPPIAMPRSDQRVASTPADIRMLIFGVKMRITGSNYDPNLSAKTIHPLAVKPRRIAFAAYTTVARPFGFLYTASR